MSLIARHIHELLPDSKRKLFPVVSCSRSLLSNTANCYILCAGYHLYTAKMSKLLLFRDCIRERLTTAALEIFEAVEKTFAEFQEEIYNSKKESARLKRLLDIVIPPEIKIHRTELKLLSVREPPQIKEEQEPWTSQEEEQLQRLQSETTDPRFTEESQFVHIKMSQLDEIREHFGEILSSAALKIYCTAEKSFEGYQEERTRSEEERKCLKRLLDVVTQPEIKLHRTEVQHLSLPEPPQTKEKQQLWTSQGEEQLQGLKSETKDSIFTSLGVEHDSDQEGSSVCSHLVQAVKVEDIEGDSLPSSSTEEQIKTEPHVQDYAAPEPGSDSQPLSVVAPDCSGAQRLEEHGGVMFLQNKTRNNEAVSRNNQPQGSHTGEKPQQCQECKKQFAFKSTLLKHMRTHTGEKHFHCQQCDKQFTRKCYLFDHMITHTVEKPFQCQQCTTQFLHKKSLVSHMKKHTGEKPHKCQECKKQFAFKSALLQHIRIHTGEKPFHCQQCDKQFTKKCYLVDHMRTHTSEKPFQCQLCNTQFLHKKSLFSHMKKHTGDKQ